MVTLRSFVLGGRSSYGREVTGLRLVALVLLVLLVRAPVAGAQTARDDELARRLTGPDVADRHAAADEALGRAAFPADAQ